MSIVLYLRVSSEVKEEIERIAKNSGMTITAVSEVLLRRALKLPDKTRSLEQLIDWRSDDG